MSDNGDSPSVLRLFVQRARSLYSLPGVAFEVLELTRYDQVDAAALRACIEHDPALTAKLLRVVNSALFGLSREVSDLNQAIALLGVKPLKLLVLGFSLPRELFQGIEAEALERYWRHSLYKSVAARELSLRFWQWPGDEAFLAALLQGLGMLVLIQELGDPYLRFLQRISARGGRVAELEQGTLGFDHRILSARLLEQWLLPEAIVRAVAAPHDPAEIAALPTEQRPLPEILHLAELIADLFTQPRPRDVTELQAVAREYRQIPAVELEQLLVQLDEKVATLAELFSVKLLRHDGGAEVLRRAHDRLALVAADAACDLVQNSAADPGFPETCAAVRGALAAAERQEGRRMATPTRVPGSGVVASLPQPSTPHPVSAPDLAARSLADPGLLGRLTAAVAVGRQHRCEVSLVLFELQDYQQRILTRGLDETEQVAQALRLAIRALCDRAADCLQIDDNRYALLMPHCDRPQALKNARHILRHAGPWLKTQGVESTPLTLAAGVATLTVATKNFPAEQLLAAAERCLYGARDSGGTVVKSIDVL